MSITLTINLFGAKLQAHASRPNRTKAPKVPPIRAKNVSLILNTSHSVDSLRYHPNHKQI